MNRRTLLAGASGLVASGVFVTGTGAFSSVSTERQVEVRSASDSQALLRIEAIGTGFGQRSVNGNTVMFQFPSFRETESDGVNPQNPGGLGTDSVYRFASDINGSDGLFVVKNRGTQPVDLYGTQQKDSEDIPDVKIFDVHTGTVLTTENPYEDLGVGQELSLGFQIDTTDVEARDQSYDVSVIINAIA